MKDEVARKVFYPSEDEIIIQEYEFEKKQIKSFRKKKFVFTMIDKIKYFFEWINTPKCIKYNPHLNHGWFYKHNHKIYSHTDRKELIKHYTENHANLCIPPRRWLDF